MKIRYTLLLLIPLVITACKVTLEEANRAFDLYRFDKAASMYEELYNQKGRPQAERAAIAFKAAESYRKKNDWQSAERWYEKAIRRGYSDPMVYYQLARIQNMQKDFEKAKENYKKFIKNAPGREEMGKKGIKQVKRYKAWQDDTTRYVIKEEERLNSRENDYAPSYLGDRQTIVFTSDREKEEGGSGDTYKWTGLPFSDIYIAEWDEKREYYDDVRPIEGEVNTPFNEGVTSFGERGRKMYYTQCNGPEGEKTNCRIMVARKQGRRGYGDPEKLPFCTDSTVNYSNPSISENEKKIFFSSDMEGGEGGLDLYVSHYVSRSRTWGEPVNLGETINTEGDESFPYVYENNKLYFASTGHNSIGGYDVFVSEWNGESWSDPENLKYPINSPGDDFKLIFTNEGNQGHFTTNREGRGDNIYGFYLKKLEFVLTGVVTNSNTGDSVNNAVVKLRSNVSETPDTVVTGEDGFYRFELPKQAQFEVDAKKEGFFRSQKEFVSTRGYEYSREFKRDLQIEPYPPEEIEIEGIYYGLDSANIRPESEKALDSLVTILRNNPTITIELRSHTDCRASKEYNRKLSQRRADSVVGYLIRHGIDSARLKPKGYGESQLVNNCSCEGGEGPGLECTEAEHQQNRRTTFKILSTDYKPDRPTLHEGDFQEKSPTKGSPSEDGSTPPSEGNKQNNQEGGGSGSSSPPNEN